MPIRIIALRGHLGWERMDDEQNLIEHLKTAMKCWVEKLQELG